MYSEITINKDLTFAYFNALAHEVLYKRKTATYFKLTNDENCFVFEDVGNKELCLRLGFNIKHLEDVKKRYNEERFLFVIALQEKV